MDSANTLCLGGECKGGVLAHLERLEAQMNRSSRRSEELTVHTKESSLRTKIHELRRQRDKLRAEVKQRRATIKVSSANEDPNRTVELSEPEDLARQWGNVKSILRAYRFTGLSGKLTSHGVCVCISTAFEGNLLDSYFVDFVIEKPLRIHHHSIPVFIPLEKIATAYLQTDIQRFLFSLWEYLNAYSGRKYQMDLLETDFSAFLTGPLQRNALCNLLSFTYEVDQGRQTFSFSATLQYENLTAALPTDVTVTCPGAEASTTCWEEHKAAHEILFQTKPLHQVFASFSKQVEMLDLSLVS
ncbi:centromere protein O [Phodopus roborovskii]|uniref:Centromere protein O n=1 Tax=Phodopus roborovskii TaxID=109678 RepID=A0AAU9Z4I7_PHORO|nr:centromere protein O [Phodopus roborovskii]CAH6786875.1 Cenpo [Phodopus roborovskii]